MLKIKAFLTAALLAAGLTAFAQQVTVTGVVTSSADGYGVIGAAVMEKGTSNGVVTDFDGNFTLRVELGKTLEISCIGYRTIEVAAAENMAVVLDEDVAELSEVVVTGYQTQRKADLTGSISVIKTDEMKTTSGTDPMRALQGRVPGMTITSNGSPSGAGTVRIRGIGSFNSSQDPLYIIDGVPTTSGLNSLNTNDIESMQVLKDAASASNYGLNLNAPAGTQIQAYDPATSQMNTYTVNGLYDGFMNAKKTMRYSDTDWLKAISRTGFLQSYDLSLSNVSERSSVLVSVGYKNNLGILKYTDFENIAARVNSSLKINKYITVGENLTITHTSQVDGAPMENALKMSPTLPVFEEDGTTFSGSLPEGASLGDVLVYPEGSHSVSGSTLYVHYPDTYTYPADTTDSRPVMVAALSDNSAAFKHVGGLMRIRYKNVPMKATHMVITLNKHQGIRAGLAWSSEIGRLVKEHNNANVLVLPARFIPYRVASSIVRTWLGTPFAGGRHQRRIDKIPCR